MDGRGPWTGHLTKPAQVCFCNEGWICEQHSDRGWPHDDCAGPGMPCPRCYPNDARPPMPAGWKSYVAPERGLFFAYGHKSDGLYFLGNSEDVNEAIRRGRTFLDRYRRVTVQNVRANLTVWDSDDLETPLRH